MAFLDMPIESKKNLFSSPDVAERLKSFAAWVGGFFAHRDAYSGKLEDLEFNTPRSDKPGSFHDLTDKELEQLTCMDAFATHESFIMAVKPEVFRFLALRTLFDPEMASDYLPHLKITFACTSESGGPFLGVLHELGRCLKQGPAVVYDKGAKQAREVKLKYLERGNHFVFWHEPQWALQQFRACIEQ